MSPQSTDHLRDSHRNLSGQGLELGAHKSKSSLGHNLQEVEAFLHAEDGSLTEVSNQKRDKYLNLILAVIIYNINFYLKWSFRIMAEQ